jgi:ATP-binding cassette subfamily C (CFTR/MRP) protein 10
MIAIAHRASSLAWMDRVLVMEDGRIIEDGNPSTLLQENGAGRESYYRTSVAKDGLKAVAKASETAKYWDNINARLKQDVSR